MFRIGPTFYVGTFFLLLLYCLILVCPGIALIFLVPNGQASYSELIGLALLDLLILAVVWSRCSQPGLPFWQSLKLITSGYMSGCANLTFFYIYIVLFVAYITAVVFTVIGLFKGAGYTRDQWKKYVYDAVKRRAAAA
jgi:hypothetical protein